MKIKDLVGVTVSSILGGEAIRAVGNSGMLGGLRDTTQSLIGVGVVGNASKLFKWK